MSDLDHVRLWLDHASVEVPDLHAAVEHLDRRLGLRATISPNAPERHSRVHLDRSYVEVSARPGGHGWRATLWFLRFDDPARLRSHLDRVGLGYRFGDYEGVDGTWDDVELGAGAVPMPILVRRTRPPEIAASWPPALAEPHRCGARTLAQVHLGVPSIDDAIGAYTGLLGVDEPPPAADPRSGRPRVELATASGTIVLLGGGTGAIEQIVLGVSSLAAPSSLLGERLVRHDGDPVAWIDTAETYGLGLGFVEDAVAAHPTG